MSEGYYIATKNEDGTAGRPVGFQDEAIALFSDLAVARRVAKETGETLHIFKIGFVQMGEVVA